MSRPNFKRLDPADAPAIATLLEAAYAPYRATLPDLPDMTDGLATELADTENWALDDADGLTAVILLHPSDNALFIKNLAVRPDTQGQGLARKLLDFAQDRARALHLPRLLLTTHAQMNDTIAVYERLGFAVTERFQGALRLAKSVPPSVPE